MAAVSGQAEAAVPGELRRAIIDAARVPVTETLRKSVRFKVEQLKAVGDWAFLYADMQDDQGRPVSYQGTELADAAAHGAVSRAYAALLRRSDGRWTVVAKAIGPTDVAWAGWAREFGAPAELFQD